jgi:hypothetical protein
MPALLNVALQPHRRWDSTGELAKEGLTPYYLGSLFKLIPMYDNFGAYLNAFNILRFTFRTKHFKLSLIIEILDMNPF